MAEQIPNVAILEQRIRLLEHQNRVMKWGMASVTLLLVMGALISCRIRSTIPATIQARGFEVVDSLGNVKAELKDDFYGGALRLRGYKGEERISVGSDACCPFLRMYGGPLEGKGKKNVELQAFGDSAHLTLFYSDPQSKPEKPALLLMSDIRGGTIDLMREDGKEGVIIHGGGGLMGLSIEDEKRQERLKLGSVELINPFTGERTPSSLASLVIFNKEGKIIWSSPQDDGGVIRSKLMQCVDDWKEDKKPYPCYITVKEGGK
jgi:hypothetical protein